MRTTNSLTSTEAVVHLILTPTKRFAQLLQVKYFLIKSQNATVVINIKIKLIPMSIRMLFELELRSVKGLAKKETTVIPSGRVQEF